MIRDSFCAADCAELDLLACELVASSALSRVVLRVQLPLELLDREQELVQLGLEVGLLLNRLLGDAGGLALSQQLGRQHFHRRPLGVERLRHGVARCRFVGQLGLQVLEVELE